MRSYFIAFIVTSACAVGVIGAKPEFPVLYSGGAPKPVLINVNLILRSKTSYLYSEFDKNYSVEDSGTYIISGNTIVLNSINTIHQLKRRNKKIINGKRISQKDSINHQKLFIEQKCSIRADTIVIRERNVLMNESLGFYLVNFHK